MPRTDAPLTPAERNRRSRAARAVAVVALPGAVIAQIDALAARDGDASRAACVARLVAVASKRRSATTER